MREHACLACKTYRPSSRVVNQQWLLTPNFCASAPKSPSSKLSILDLVSDVGWIPHLATAGGRTLYPKPPQGTACNKICYVDFTRSVQIPPTGIEAVVVLTWRYRIPSAICYIPYTYPQFKVGLQTLWSTTFWGVIWIHPTKGLQTRSGSIQTPAPTPGLTQSQGG